MGYFAVLDPTGRGAFKVVECHLNLWALGGLWPGRHVFVVDLGLALEATTRDVNDINRVRVLFPFGTAKDGYMDLATSTLQPRTAELIFAKRNVEVRPGDVIRHSDDGTSWRYLQVTRLASANLLTRTDGERISDWDRSCWELTLSRSLVAGSETYIRARFEITRTARTWTWKGRGLARNGALLDFRVADARESFVVQQWEAFRDQVVAIGQLHVFVVVPARFQARITYPQPAYARLLEGRAWEEYLSRPVAVRRKTRMIVLHWQAASVDLGMPFRSFADFSRERRISYLWNAIYLILPGGAGYGIWVGASDLGRAWKWSVSFGTIGLLGALLLFLRKKLFDRPDPGQPMPVSRKLRRAERRILEVLRVAHGS